MSELGESDNDIFNADFEDNNSTMSEDPDSENEFIIKGDENRHTSMKQHFSEDDDIQTRLPGPNYLNNSFTGPYPEDMSRPYVDKGPNPQFMELDEAF